VIVSAGVNVTLTPERILKIARAHANQPGVLSDAWVCVSGRHLITFARDLLAEHEAALIAAGLQQMEDDDRKAVEAFDAVRQTYTQPGTHGSAAAPKLETGDEGR
jgi:hypothetical protein